MLKSLLIVFSPRPDYRTDPRFAREYHWYRHKWKPKANVDYSKSLSYANEQYKETLSVFDSLDKKAEWCFALSVTISGAVIAFGDKVGMDMRILFPSIALLLLSMWACLRWRLPGPRATPFDVRSFIEITENTHSDDARTAASLHCAIQGVRIVVAWKSRLLGCAAILLAISILWIGIFYSFLSV